MKKQILIVCCTAVLSSFSLRAMEPASEEERQLMMNQFSDVLYGDQASEVKLNFMQAWGPGFVENGIIEESFLNEVIQNLSASVAPSSLQPISSPVIDQRVIDRRIREEQERAYEESLRIDQEKDAVRKISSGWRNHKLRKNFRENLNVLRDNEQDQFEFLEPLDKAIVQLATRGNSRPVYGQVSQELGNNIGLLQLFRRQGSNVAAKLSERDHMEGADADERMTTLCDAIIPLLECDYSLAFRRASRIVNDYLGNMVTKTGVVIEEIEEKPADQERECGSGEWSDARCILSHIGSVPSDDSESDSEESDDEGEDESSNSIAPQPKFERLVDPAELGIEKENVEVQRPIITSQPVKRSWWQRIKSPLQLFKSPVGLSTVGVVALGAACICAFKWLRG